MSAAGRPVGRGSAAAGGTASIAIPKPRLWSPSKPFLYDLRVSLRRSGKIVDRVGSYFGMRNVSVARDERGFQRLMLNGKFVFQLGPLDQGFWPDGLYTRPDGRGITLRPRDDEEARFQHGPEARQGRARAVVLLGQTGWDCSSGRTCRAATTRPPKRGSSSNTNWRARGDPPQSSLHHHVGGFNEGWGQYDTERLRPKSAASIRRGWSKRQRLDGQGAGDVMTSITIRQPRSPEPQPDGRSCSANSAGWGSPSPATRGRRSTGGTREWRSRNELTAKYVRSSRPSERP